MNQTEIQAIYEELQTTFAKLSSLDAQETPTGKSVAGVNLDRTQQVWSELTKVIHADHKRTFVEYSRSLTPERNQGDNLAVSMRIGKRTK